MIKYIEQDSLCRNLFLQDYLGESSLRQYCGNCDICEFKSESKDINIVLEVENLLSENSDLTSAEIIKRIDSPRENIIKTLRFLLENGRIELNSQKRLMLVK
jgi:superfamily II DNA helicase RecQ